MEDRVPITPEAYLARNDELITAEQYEAVAAFVEEHDRALSPLLSNDEFLRLASIMEPIEMIIRPGDQSLHPGISVPTDLRRDAR